MTRLSIDNNVQELEGSVNQSLSEFLKIVFAALPPNRIVTDIVLDGERMPRAGMITQEMLKRAVGNIQQLEIRTADAAIWEQNGIELAIMSLDQLRKSLIRSAQLFREEKKLDANRFFYRCIEGLEKFLENILITKNIRQLDFNKIHSEGIPLSQVEKDFIMILNAILEMQTKQDYTGIADKIEYELLTNLYTWNKALAQLQITLSSNA